MTELAFRAYNDGQNIVAVAFPTADDATDSAVLEKRWPLDSIGLSTDGAPPEQYDMPFDTWSVKNRKSLVRGGLELVVDYESERITVTPLTRNKSRLEDRTVRYRFEDLSLEENRTSKIQKAKKQTTLRATKDKLPLDEDETWP